MSKSTTAAPKFVRAAEVRAASYTEADNSIDVIWTTGAAVRRLDWQTGEPYTEVLDVTVAAVRLGRLNAGAPLLDTHDAGSLRSVIGSVVPGSARIEGGVGLARVRLSDAEDDAGTVGKIRTGIIRNVSVGYRVLKVRKTEREDADTEWRVVDWEPMELSAVPVPADAGAQFRADNDDVAPVEFVGAESDERAAGKETLRVGTITQLAVSGRAEEFGREHIRAGTSVEEFRTILLDRIVERENQSPVNGNIRGEVGTEHVEKRASAVENALLHRSDPDAFPLSPAGRELRGLDLLDIARHVLEAGGMKIRGMTREEIAAEALSKRGGYHGTGDFPTILGNVGNATLRRAYDAAPQTFRPFVRETTVPDFKVVSRVQISEGPPLEKVNEHGEYKRGTIGEGGESYRVYSFGKIIGLTRQALINDQFEAFSRLPQMFGVQAANLESDLVWAQLLGNPLMGDGTALCALSRKNLATSLTALTSPSAVAALSAGTTAMAKMRGLDGKTTLNIKPSFLITGEDGRPAAQVIVEQELSPISPSMAVPRRVRDLKLIVEPRVDLGISRPDVGIEIAGTPDSWWLAVAPTWLDTIEIAYLEGEKHLRLEAKNSFNQDGCEFKASIDVGAKAIDHRGFYKGN